MKFKHTKLIKIAIGASVLIVIEVLCYKFYFTYDKPLECIRFGKAYKEMIVNAKKIITDEELIKSKQKEIEELAESCSQALGNTEESHNKFEKFIYR